MALVYFSGWETGDTSEWASSNNTFSVQTTTVNPHGGNYALQGTVSSNFNATSLTISPTLTEGWCRFYVNLHAIKASLTTNDLDLAAFGASRVMCVTDASGNPSLQLWNASTSAAVGSASAVSLDVWHLVETHFLQSATVGTLEMKIDGVLVASSVGNLNTNSQGASAIAVQTFNDSGLHTPTGTVYFDDVAASNSTWIGGGYVIARQFNATVPNYNTFTKVGGTNIQDVWDNTPFTTGTNATDAVSTGKQTGVTNFGSTTDTGATSRGPGFVTRFDTIHGAKVGAVAKTGTASDAADSIIFRTPAGGSGVDTITAFSAGWATTDSYKEVILGTTPTAAQILNCEAGIQHNATTNTHTYEDVWLIIDFTPGVMSSDWNFWTLGQARLIWDRETDARALQSGAFTQNLQHRNPPAPRTPASNWQWWLDAAMLARAQGDAARLAAVQNFVYNLQHWPVRMPPAERKDWEWWRDAAQLRQAGDLRSQILAASIFLNNLQHRALLGVSEREDWQWWQDAARIYQDTQARALVQATNIFQRDLQHWSIPVLDQRQDWQWWVDAGRMRQMAERLTPLLSHLFQRNLQHWAIPPQVDVREVWQFWLQRMVPEVRQLILSPNTDVMVTPPPPPTEFRNNPWHRTLGKMMNRQ